MIEESCNVDHGNATCVLVVNFSQSTLWDVIIIFYNEIISLFFIIEKKNAS